MTRTGPLTDERAQAAPKAGYHHGDLRHALLAEALARIDADGADALSLAAIARTLGVSQAAPYRHFSDRDALLAAVAAEGFAEFSTALESAAADGPPELALERMCRAYFAFGLGRPGLYRLMFDSAVFSFGQDPLLSQRSLASFALLVDALPPGVPAERRQARAFSIWAALHGGVLLVSRGLIAGRDPATVTGNLIAEILR